MKFAFAGTPEFASWVLVNLVELGWRPSLVISQPDRPRGRGRPVGTPAVVCEAGHLGLECVQTDDINEPRVLERLRDANVSALVVASFGQMLGRTLLESVLCLNVHTSLLPKYRGAAPIERALAAGERSTGVTVMRVTERLDEGPWALQKELSLSLHDDAGSVARALAVLGAIGIAQVLVAIADGTVEWTPQQGPSSYAHKLTCDDCELDFTMGAKAVHDRVRSLSPAVGARVSSGDLDLKILRTWPYGQAGLPKLPAAALPAAGAPGKVVALADRLFVGCGEGAIEVLLVQPAGRARMTAAAFLRGYGGRLAQGLGPARRGAVSGSAKQSREECV